MKRFDKWTNRCITEVYSELVKTVPMKCKITIFILTVLSALSLPLAGVPDGITWGMTRDDFVKSLQPEQKISLFTPRDMPDYDNKIISYITAIDENIKREITILRVSGLPQMDYLFIGDRLYSIMEDWKRIDPKTTDALESRLKSRYGEPTIQKNNSFFIHSYNHVDSKILLYKNVETNNHSTCRIYYYTSKLFRMLILK
jgi:hypothetical protein